jgi:hypothetical protein
MPSQQRQARAEPSRRASRAIACADGEKRLHMATNEDWTANARAAIWAQQIAGFAKLSGSIGKLPKKALLDQSLNWGMV